MSPDINSPTGMDIFPPAPTVRRVSKRIVIVLAAMATIVILLVIYGLHRRQRVRTEMAQKPGGIMPQATPALSAGRAVADEVPLGNIASRSLVGSSPGSSGNEAQAPDPIRIDSELSAPAAPRRAAPVPVTPPSPEPTAEDRRRQTEYDREQQAIDAPTSIRGGEFNGYGSVAAGLVNLPSGQADPSNSGGSAQSLGGGLGGQAGLLAGESAAPLDAQEDKLAFIAQSRSAKASDNYLGATRTPPLGKYEIKAGWDIPAILEQELNSDLPGEIRALVRQDVYDTATGKYLLIPHGARLVGEYNSHITYGQARLQVVWSRIIFPDGSSVNLNGMLGHDAGGNSGLGYKVDNHYRRLIGFAVLTSLFSAGFQLSQSRHGNILTTPNAGEIAAGAVGQQLSQLGAEVTRKNLNVQPTLLVPAGFRFNVRVNRDILFGAPYQARKF